MRVVVLLTVPFLNQVLAGPGKPIVSIGLNSDAMQKSPIGALEPQVQWQTSGTYAGYDVSVGREMDGHVVDRIFFLNLTVPYPSCSLLDNAHRLDST